MTLSIIRQHNEA
jgi:hypothetical protein